MHCGGISIKTWDDSSNANYGAMDGLESCKTTCNKHDECAGFVSRANQDNCGHWKRGPLKLTLDHGCYDCYDCYEKITTNLNLLPIEYRITHGKHCGGISIKTWDDNSNAKYGKMKGFESCRTACNNHDECSGFVSSPSHGVCGFWKRGVLTLTEQHGTGYDCYEKKIKKNLKKNLSLQTNV